MNNTLSKCLAIDIKSSNLPEVDKFFLLDLLEKAEQPEIVNFSQTKEKQDAMFSGLRQAYEEPEPKPITKVVVVPHIMKNANKQAVKAVALLTERGKPMKLLRLARKLKVKDGGSYSKFIEALKHKGVTLARIPKHGRGYYAFLGVWQPSKAVHPDKGGRVTPEQIPLSKSPGRGGFYDYDALLAKVKALLRERKQPIAKIEIMKLIGVHSGGCETRLRIHIEKDPELVYFKAAGKKQKYVTLKQPQVEVEQPRERVVHTDYPHRDFPFTRQRKPITDKRAFQKQFMQEAFKRHSDAGDSWTVAFAKARTDYSDYCKKRDGLLVKTPSGQLQEATPEQFVGAAMVQFPEIKGITPTIEPYLKDMLRRLDNGKMDYMSAAMDTYVLNIPFDFWPDFLAEIMSKEAQIKEALGLTKGKNFLTRYNKLYFE